MYLRIYEYVCVRACKMLMAMVQLLLSGIYRHIIDAFSGIFAYLNFLTPRSRAEIIEILVNGLKRLEYRGYDSAGKCCQDYFSYLYLEWGVGGGK